MASTTKPHVRSLSCPNCGGTVELRGMGRSLTAVCIQCLSLLDSTGSSLRLIEQFRAKERFRPLIPLGTRGKLRGEPYEVIGFQVRQMFAEGMPYSWSEYVLFNPYKGFRYLTEYNGHWNDVTPVHSVPSLSSKIGRPTATLLGETFTHFQHYDAETIFVMGEFPWQVRSNERSICDDYVSPPRMLSREQSANESVWSVGEYTPHETIAENFGLKGKLPSPRGIFANQPSPHHGKVRQAWGRFAFWVFLLLFVQLFFVVFHSNRTVFDQTYFFAQQTGRESSFVTGVFELPGRTSSVEVELNTNLDNSAAYFDLALINAENGSAYAFGRNVSYYHGRDSDGNWSEGRARDSVVLPTVPAGKYYLRVEPEMDTDQPATASRSVQYEIKVKRDVTTWVFFWIGFLVLLIPPILTTIRSGSFESRRWAESDYGGSSNSDSGGDDE